MKHILTPEDFLESQGFIYGDFWHDKYWVKKISDDYCFWFSLYENDVQWGVAETCSGENIYASEENLSFEQAYKEFINEQDRYQVLNVRIAVKETEDLQVLVTPEKNVDQRVIDYLTEHDLDPSDYYWKVL